jgi:hypothetical protein
MFLGYEPGDRGPDRHVASMGDLSPMGAQFPAESFPAQGSPMPFIDERPGRILYIISA